MKKALLYPLAVLAILVLAAWAALPTAVDTARAQNLVHRLLVEHVDPAARFTIAFGQVRVDHLFRVTVEDAVLTRDGLEFFSARSVRSGPMLFSLLKMPVDLGDVELVEPVITVRRFDSGAWNMLPWKKRPGEKSKGKSSKKRSGPPASPVIGRARTENGRFRAILAPARGKPGYTGEGTFSVAGDCLADRARAESITVTLPGFSLLVTHAELSFAGEPMSGAIKVFGRDLTPLRALAPFLPALTGVSADLKISGSVGSPRVSFALSAEPGQEARGLARAEISAKPRTASLTATFNHLATATFSPLTATANGGIEFRVEQYSLSKGTFFTDLSLKDSVIRGVRVEEGALSAEMKALDLTRVRATARTPGGAFTLDASGRPAGLVARSQAMSLSAVVSGTELDPAAWGAPDKAAGRLEARVAGRVEKPAGEPLSRTSATGRAEFSGKAQGFTLQDGALAFSAGPEGLAVDDGRLAWKDGTLGFSGRLDRAGKDMEVRVSPDIRDLSGITGLFLPVPVRGGLRGEAVARGTPRAPRVKGALSAQNLAWGDFAARELSLSADGDLSSWSGAAELSAQGVRAKGRDLDSVTARVSGDGSRADYEVRAEGREAGLALSSAGTVEGLAGPVREIRASSLDVAALGMDWKGSAAVGLSPDRVSVKALDLAWDGQAVSASGWVSYTGGVSAAVAARDVRLDRVAALLAPGRGIAGLARADLTLENTFADPRMDLSARVDGLLVRQGTPPARVEVSASYEKGEARARAGAWPQGGGTLAASGRVPILISLPRQGPWLPDAGLELAVTARDLPLGFMAGLVPRVKTLTALADADLTLTGAPRSPRVEGRASVSGDLLALAGIGAPIRDFSVDVTLSPGTFTVRDLSARVGETGSIRASGSLDAGESNLSARVAGVDLLPWTRALLPGPALAGTLGGEVAVAGTPDAPIIRASATAENLGLPDRPGVPASDLSLNASYEGGSAEFSGRLAPRSGGEFVVNGSLPLILAWPFDRIRVPGEGLSVDIQGNDISLAFLPAFVEAVESTDARMDLSARISGDPRSPAFSGTAKVLGKDLALEGWEAHLKDLSAGFSWDSESRVRLTEFSARSGDRGRVSGRGSVELARGRPESVDLALTCKDLKVSAGGLVTAMVGADLTATGPLPGVKLSGKIRVGEGVFRLERFLESRAARVPGLEDVHFVGEKVPEPEKGPAFLKQAALDVAVMVDGPFWVRGAGAQIELSGDIRAEKPAGGDGVAVTGHLETLKGFYSFTGRTFEIRPGRVIFTGRVPPDPNLDIPAAYRVSDVTVLLHIHGSASSPVLSLSGDPPMGEAEAMSFLMFGKPPDKLTGGQSTSLQQQALGFFGSRVLGELKQYMGQEIPLDLLALEKGTGQEAGSQVVMGKYVNPNLFVTYRRGVSSQGGNEVRLEYTLTSHFSIQSQASEVESGADLFFTLDY